MGKPTTKLEFLASIEQQKYVIRQEIIHPQYKEYFYYSGDVLNSKTGSSMPEFYRLSSAVEFCTIEEAINKLKKWKLNNEWGIYNIDTNKCKIIKIYTKKVISVDKTDTIYGIN